MTEVLGPRRRRPPPSGSSRVSAPTGSRHSAHPVLAAQALVGNRAVQLLLGVDPPRAVQRREIYERRAKQASPMRADLTKRYNRRVEEGELAGALELIVDHLVARGEVRSELLRTSDGKTPWEVTESGDTIGTTFRSEFRASSTSAKLPNPYFKVPRNFLAVGENALIELHMSLLHEFRHVEQRSELINKPAGGAPEPEREPGYANDPDEFDAYLTEMEATYDKGHLVDVAGQVAVNWEFLPQEYKPVFEARWKAAQARCDKMGFTVDRLVKFPKARRYRERVLELLEKAKQASRNPRP